MKNFINKIKTLFNRRKILEDAVIETYNQLRSSNDNLVAIARLSMIKPDVLVREARNIQANGEYLLKMVEAQQELTKTNEN